MEENIDNFEFEWNGKKYWYSRSVAVANFIFCKNKNNKWCILLNKRGEGTPDYQGCWSGPCGYLNFNETVKHAAAREVFEETGLTISPLNLNFVGYDSRPSSNRQNVVFFFYMILPGTIDNYVFSTENSEKNEVADNKFVEIKNISSYPLAFKHDNIINDIYNKYINISWYKRTILNLYKKYFEYNN